MRNRGIRTGRRGQAPGHLPRTVAAAVRPAALAAVLSFCPAAAGAEERGPGLPSDVRQLVADTHAASLKRREAALRRTIAKDTCWPGGVWGETLWNLAALHLGEKSDQANARLRQRALEYIAAKPVNGARPEDAGPAPWTYFSLADYVRTFYLFHAKSPYFPGRLKPDTEAAMREALWLWVREQSRMNDTGPEDLFLLLGTENHDLNLRPNQYLITAALMDDPAYRDRRLADGHTVAQHAAAHAAFFREWPRARVRSGMWIEIGSNTYQKYSWPALFNLHELAPDPVVRHRFGLFLDLACIEEAQISVRGRRGGGRSRAQGGRGGFESCKDLLYADAGGRAGSSHSRVIETSRYQVPAAAVLLRKRTFPAAEPFVIRNRVLGRAEALRPDDRRGHRQRIAADSALVNYAYRRPHYLLGSTLQDPSLNYAGISRQKRWCGLLTADPSAESVGGVHPVIEKTRGGRPQHPFWSIQHENVLVLQRIAKGDPSAGGSYSTGRISMRFEGPAMDIAEEDGWIFAGNGRAFVGVRFLDGGHRWDEARAEAFPAKFTGHGDTGRILLHAGDVGRHGSFEAFRRTVRANPLVVTPDKVDYRFGAGREHLVMKRWEAGSADQFSLPRVNGAAIDLHPAAAYDSPYLNGVFGSDRITVTVGPVERVLDFSQTSG